MHNHKNMNYKIYILIFVGIYALNNSIEKTHNLMMNRLKTIKTEDNITLCIINSIKKYDGFSNSQNFENITNIQVDECIQYIANILDICHLTRYRTDKYGIYNQYLGNILTHTTLYKRKYKKNSKAEIYEIIDRLNKMFIRIENEEI